jgi:hypothetical protein
MHESRETLLKNKEWKRLLELSNKIYCEWLLNEHDEYKNDFIKAFDFHNNTHNDLK